MDDLGLPNGSTLMENIIGDYEEFLCRECGHWINIKHKGKATLNDEPYDVCVWCCTYEQQKQNYATL